VQWKSNLMRELGGHSGCSPHWWRHNLGQSSREDLCIRLGWVIRWTNHVRAPSMGPTQEGWQPKLVVLDSVILQRLQGLDDTICRVEWTEE
jgi:hypothetical protein